MQARFISWGVSLLAALPLNFDFMESLQAKTPRATRPFYFTRYYLSFLFYCYRKPSANFNEKRHGMQKLLLFWVLIYVFVHCAFFTDKVS